MHRKVLITLGILIIVVVSGIATAKNFVNRTYNLRFKYSVDGWPAFVHEGDILGQQWSYIGGESFCDADHIREYELAPCSIYDVEGVRIEIKKNSVADYAEFHAAFWDPDAEEWTTEGVTVNNYPGPGRNVYISTYEDEGNPWDYNSNSPNTYVMSVCFRYPGSSILYERRYWVPCDL